MGVFIMYIKSVDETHRLWQNQLVDKPVTVKFISSHANRSHIKRQPFAK